MTNLEDKISVIKPSWELSHLSKSTIGEMEKHLEQCGRICYKSEVRITDDSASKFVSKICRNRHESVLEHASITVKIVCSRACSHQLVRHRLASFSQESMRYCNYGKRGLQVICPPSIGVPVGEYTFNDLLSSKLSGRMPSWLDSIISSYMEYRHELEQGVKPEDARFVLPNATKTELAVTFNLRMWRHVFLERAFNRHAQWEIRSIFSSLFEELRDSLPSVFGDLDSEEIKA